MNVDKVCYDFFDKEEIKKTNGVKEHTIPYSEKFSTARKVFRCFTAYYR